MPMVLDPDLHPSLYPLAWLVGSWRGEGAVQLATEDGSEVGRRIEQEVTFTALETGALAYVARTWVFDSPAPEPPTAVFAEGGESANDEADEIEEDLEADARTDTGERTLLGEESGYWRVTGVAPGQDIEAAHAAKPGSEAAQLSHRIELVLARPEGFAETFVGDVRGPRMRLSSDTISRTASGTAPNRAERLYGLVNGHLMWVEDNETDQREFSSYISAELERG